ncbi:g3590 [Coccomyxa elongata]
MPFFRGLFFADPSLEALYQASLARRSLQLSIWVNMAMAIAWLACFPKLLFFYPITPRRVLIMLIWGTMAIYHAHCAAALSRERRLLRHEVMKAKCVIANALAGMACILLLKREEIGQGAPMPASLVQAGFILFYSVRCSIALQLHLLSWWSSIIMEFGRWIEGVPPWRSVSESLALLVLAVVLPAATSAYWEYQFRVQLLQQDEIQQQLRLDMDTLEQKVHAVLVREDDKAADNPASQDIFACTKAHAQRNFDQIRGRHHLVSQITNQEPVQPHGTMENIPVDVYVDADELSRAVAVQFASTINAATAAGKKCVLGLATGSTPVMVYRELVRLHKEGSLSFRNVITFNLDEYYGIHPDDLQSYHKFMAVHLFDHITDMDPSNIHIPKGLLHESEVQRHCDEYEAAIEEAGGIDLQLLGLGRMGHIGFNERGTSRESRTHMVYLDRVTRLDAASDFFGEQHVPRRAITMGISTILKARRILLMAFGENKAGTAARCVEGPITSQVPASFLQEHPNASVLLDLAASSGLTRSVKPWVVGPVIWNDLLVKRAVIWLARQLNKSILRLTDRDYADNSLQELCEVQGPAHAINKRVFSQLQSTITQFPGGQEACQGNGDASTFANLPNGDVDTAIPRPKRVIVMSPHPDDDVISMGGTLARLCQHGHQVYVAYQTSGCIAVHDYDALRHLDFVERFASISGTSTAESSAKHAEVKAYIARKKPGEVDMKLLQQIKTLIRYTEATSAAGVCGVPERRARFLDMPFYETGTVAKKDLSGEDIRLVVDLFQQVQPHQIYAAGDLSDPHGTHRTCLKAIFQALDEVKAQPWFKGTEVFLYRGAWQEWEPWEADMCVPMSASDLTTKIDAIFRHESQKDRALFPGADEREFWQRAQDRNKATADLYNKLGLQEYEAMEAFVRYDPFKPSHLFSSASKSRQ